jgi:hypothetical protein
MVGIMAVAGDDGAMAEVAVPRRLFASILDRIMGLRLVPGTG